MDPQNNQNPTVPPAVDPNAGMQTPPTEPTMPTPPPAIPQEPVATPSPEPQQAPVEQPPVTPTIPTEGTEDTGAGGVPPVVPPAI